MLAIGTLRAVMLHRGYADLVGRWSGRYGVPGSGVRKFEEAMQNIFPERFSEDRDILHHLVTVAPPSLLASRGEPPACHRSIYCITRGSALSRSMLISTLEQDTARHQKMVYGL